MNWQVLIKILTGIPIVPMGIAAHYMWPWWTKATLPIQILSALGVLPFVAVAAVLTQWWDEF